MYQKYHLQDYFEGTETRRAIQVDAAKTWAAARVNFPDLAFAFSRFGQAALFQAAASSLLSTLLTRTCRPAMQPFEYHVRLLHSFLLPPGEYDPADPRVQFRRLVLIIMARHEGPLLRCRNDAELMTMVEDIVTFVRVDSTLLEMLKRADQVCETPRGPLWPSALLGGLGALLAHDMSSPLGLVASLAFTTGGAASGFIFGSLQSAVWSTEAAVLRNRAGLLSGNNADVSEDEAEQEASERPHPS